ncbi:hypothetical protein GSI_07548 [Ganoderma sinense ZZ0214-1]|uniref:Transporter n=1 Tax=Ganoderma sinense ZZ0214-1 TaxID=1077348 RepID=A0A2G8S9C5_9APHY|nr:hypothetical protein GSI_07548 [Ganoderma sinense ZZ0214-1]
MPTHRSTPSISIIFSAIQTLLIICAKPYVQVQWPQGPESSQLRTSQRPTAPCACLWKLDERGSWLSFPYSATDACGSGGRWLLASSAYLDMPAISAVVVWHT